MANFLANKNYFYSTGSISFSLKTIFIPYATPDYYSAFNISIKGIKTRHVVISFDDAFERNNTIHKHDVK